MESLGPKELNADVSVHFALWTRSLSLHCRNLSYTIAPHQFLCVVSSLLRFMELFVGDNASLQGVDCHNDDGGGRYSNYPASGGDQWRTLPWPFLLKWINFNPNMDM